MRSQVTARPEHVEARVRDTREVLVTALSCLDARLVLTDTARCQLVAMHDRIDLERRRLAPVRRVAGSRIQGELDRYDRFLLGLDAVVMSVMAGPGWNERVPREADIPRLRAAVLEVVRNAPLGRPLEPSPGATGAVKVIETPRAHLDRAPSEAR